MPSPFVGLVHGSSILPSPSRRQAKARAPSPSPRGRWDINGSGSDIPGDDLLAVGTQWDRSAPAI